MGRDKRPLSTHDFHRRQSMPVRAITTALDFGTPTTSSNWHTSSTSDTFASQGDSESVHAPEPPSPNTSAQSERQDSLSNVPTRMTARATTQGTPNASVAASALRFNLARRAKSADGRAKSDHDNSDVNNTNLVSGESASSTQTATVWPSSFQAFGHGTSSYSSILNSIHQLRSIPDPLSSNSTPPATTLAISASRQQGSVDTTGWQTTETHDPDRFDLLPRVKGLFRLLDLYSEAGSNGLVDKIIISQESLGRFINSVLPGAYTNVTKIDLARLDREASLRFVGIYGSKSEIVRLLRSFGAIDDEVATLLLVEDDVSLNMRPSLRSGIYILSPAPPSDSSSIPFVRYVIYWPEGNTWNDDATGSVRKNRVTFMRYLTSLTDQIRALISPEHEAKLVFQDVNQEDDSDGDGCEISWSDYEDPNVEDRLFDFEVATENEQEEAVDVKAGFTVSHPAYCPLTADIPTSQGLSRPETLIPRFIDGETVQAVATTRFVPGADQTRELEESFNAFRFESELRNYGSVIVSSSVDAAGFDILLENGNLKALDRAAYERSRSAVEIMKQRCGKEENDALEKSNAEIKTNRPLLLNQVTKYLVPLICETYPTFKPEDILAPDAQRGETNTSQMSDPLEYFYSVCARYKSADRACQSTLREINFTSIHVPQFINLKRRFRIVKGILEKNKDLSEAQRLDLVNAMLLDGDFLAALKEIQTRWMKFKDFFKGNDEKGLGKHWKVPELDDAEFLRSLSEVEMAEPIFGTSVETLRKLAQWGLHQILVDSAKRVTDNMISAQETELETNAKALSKKHIKRAEHEATATLREAIVANLFGKGEQPVLTIYDVKPKSACQDTSSEFALKASYSGRSEPSLEISVWALDLSEDDTQMLKENPSHLPTPRMPRSATEFNLPLEWRIRRMQIIGQKKMLLVVDCPDKIRLWLFSLQTGFSIHRPQSSIPNSSGRKYVVAVDEQTRLVALAMTEPSGNVVLQEYLMDEKFSRMRSRGSPLSLNSWYTDGIPEFTHASFFNGTEELCLVEATGRIRVIMIPSRSIRPAFIHLHSNPLHVGSSPDGTALVVIEGSTIGTKSIRVFHRASFGSNESGIVKELPKIFDPTFNFCITSTGERRKVFLLGFDVLKQRVISAALKISRKETEYQFRASGEARNTAKRAHTMHNSLIDCFSEVWDRFPVAPAIQRQTLSGDGRQTASVTFVSSSVSQSFEPYFSRMVQDFKRLSHKPTKERLARILVTSSPFNEVTGRTALTSQYKAGEWIAELLCLIPIHIAVTSENRFVPLRNGILDCTLERELLGAEVSKIIDAISLGWYESIFSSYMATKPVRVVSSMGEQSVGKSYSLNHLIDSSFAGSAVRTTEGVWLSVCPRKDCLIVALDFEGVQSIERTPQEDMLLVLFNTALSNLVVFRNNFALSRDVANMFTSFQASTRLFDPAANPRLFKGRLIIAIKDVVDGDKEDIVKEFSAKLNQIVLKEQATNFISVLYSKKLSIIPWGVIQSKEFYKLFGELKDYLFGQRPTHGTAGEFLLTLKTLMAKMKAQDWGSLDQTVIKYRVATLSHMIPIALEHGRLGSSFDADELRNLDDQDFIDTSDSNSKFYLGKDEAEMERTLGALLEACGPDHLRLSSEEVESHLNGLTKSRIVHVKEWIEKNLSRFPQDNPDIRNLKREFEDLADLLRNAVRLCPAQCAKCQLRCKLNQSHQYKAHDCRTSHSCTTPCDYAEEHDEPVPCRLPAGHNGKHVCNPVFHLCGKACHLAGRKGCHGYCAKPRDHEEGEHGCSAKVHQCGEPCDLRDILSSTGPAFSCPLLCAIPHDEPHERHACDNRMACPIRCELCQRYCATGDHFHGLDDSLPHLCGQVHSCRRQCDAAGICEINTTPHSVETTFTGKHSTFSYTKYTQSAKRLDCAIPVPPGEMAHDGDHICKTDADRFHYCEESCQSCGYICTLRLGHQQPEHDTAHGSMGRTAWTVEGNTDAIVEVNGRQFATQDDGAPQLCSSICRNLGRHAHIDYCRNSDGQCQEAESEHIDVPMLPNPNRPKDWVSHKVFWTRTGFKDPYSRDEKAEFALCDVQCAGPEHQATATAPARPSFCTLPIFHPTHPNDSQPPGNSTYISGDGHLFGCPDPNNLRQAYHIIFVLDASGSMAAIDRRPLQGQPVTELIRGSNDNRLGAVLSALYGFWITRGSGVTGPRRDTYSVITFGWFAWTKIENDSASTSDQLLDRLLQVKAWGQTSFNAALEEARTIMANNWSTDRSPVVIFLSDGECRFNDNKIRDLCNQAVARGKPLSFHAVSFGNDSSSESLRRMVAVAEKVVQDDPRNPLAPVVPCSYSDAADTIRLAETFINIADSLKKPRAALLRA